MTHAYDPPVSLNWELAAQYEEARRLQRQGGEEAAARGRRRSSRLRRGDSEDGLEEDGADDAGTGADAGAEAEAGQLMALGGLDEEVVRGDEGSWQGEVAGERDCRGGISEDCQAWKEATLVAAGELEVPRLRTGCRATQVQTEDEVQVVATAVEAEGSRCALGKRGQGGGGQRRRGRAAGKQKKAKVQPQGEVRSDGGQGWQVTGERRVEGQGGTGICDQGGVLGDRRARVLGDALEVRDDMLPGPRGEGPGWRAGQEAYVWDRVTGQILERDGRPTRNGDCC